DLNYCRNPTAAERPWCFVSTDYKRWEFCDIPFCPGRKVEPECKLTEMGREYIGMVNVTKTGKQCLSWDSPELLAEIGFAASLPYENQLFSFRDPYTKMNFCRNPMSKEMPWCFVGDGNLKWEYCSIPLCDRPSAPECKESLSGSKYIGAKNWTVFGAPCLPWSPPIPKLKSSPFSEISSPDNVPDDHNNCRNPDSSPGPWCLIEWTPKNQNFPLKVREACHVRSCFREEMEKTCEAEGTCNSNGVVALQTYPECRMTTMGKEYRGTQSKTQSGKKCLDWKTYKLMDIRSLLQQQLPVADMNTLNERQYISEFISKQDLNYCRNPTSAEEPWCFVSTFVYPLWEFCDIPFCPGRKGLSSFDLRGYYARERAEDVSLSA
ncbi:unnamed protein product, partial [Darwinula stevensoni]